MKDLGNIFAEIYYVNLFFQVIVSLFLATKEFQIQTKISFA